VACRSHAVTSANQTGAVYDSDGHLDVEASLAAMQPSGASVNDIQPKVILSLLQRATPPTEVIDTIVDATMDMATRNGLPWTREVELKCVDRRVDCGLKKLQDEYDYRTGEVPRWLAEEFHQKWADTLAKGGRPRLSRNRHNKHLFSVWAYGTDKEEPKEDEHGDKAGEKVGNANLRFRIVSFGDMRPGVEPLYLIDELIPVKGLVDIWGKPKCFKSFVVLDMMLHVALGWEYHDRSVRQGAVVYCAFEGAHGYKKRVEALRRHYEITTHVPLYIMPGQANLIKDHVRLIADLKAQLGDVVPTAVVLDTLNKSLIGSESKDIDMSAYLRAAEAIRDAFGCVVVIVHHCGLDETRPRGHTSLPGAVDAQIAVVREGNAVTVTVEHMRDGPEETFVTCVAKSVDVGVDANGKILNSLVMVPGEAVTAPAKRWSKSLTVFRRALDEALIGSTETTSINGVPHPAANLDVDVRGEFNKNYVAKGETKRQQQDNRKHAFRSAVTQAQRLNLIGVRVYEDRTLVWHATRSE
jgi:hypothetical protein